MPGFPRIATARLVLRAFASADAPAIQQLAGAREVADQTLLPHPYADGVAEAWIATRRAAHERGEATDLAIERVLDGALVGAIGLAFEPGGARAKLGYWVGLPYWGRGYATEAAAAVVTYGFETRALERIWSPCFRGNAASARVLEKIGFAHEGCRRRFVAERTRAETVEQHGVLRWEYLTRVAQWGFANEAGTREPEPKGGTGHVES